MTRGRVLYWVQDFLPSIGGVQVLAGHLLPELRARGWDVCVVASRDFTDLPPESEWDGIPVHRFPFREALTAGDPALLVETRNAVAALKRRFRPELVHVNLTDPSVFFHLQTTAAWPAPFLLTTRVDMTQRTAGPATILGRALEAADRVTTISGALLDNLLALAPGIGAKATVIHNALPLPDAAPASLPFAPPRLLCFGRVAPEKGFDVALRALARLAPTHPGLTLEIVGEGSALADLQALARQLGVDERVEFTGRVEPDAVPAAVDGATLVLVPSRWQEGFGLVALQAHQRGRPVVASRVGGLPEVVADGRTGVLVDPDDSVALAGAVARLLADPPGTRAMGDAARRRAEEVFGWARHVEAYDGIYRELVAGVQTRHGDPLPS